MRLNGSQRPVATTRLSADGALPLSSLATGGAKTYAVVIVEIVGYDF